MARPQKDGLLYFSFDTDFFYADSRIKVLKARYGSDGLIFYIYLLTEIYRNGYYLVWNEDSEDNALADLNFSDGLIKQVMKFLVNRSLLTSILVNSDTIITSPGIQKRYQEAVKSLKRDIYVFKEIWLLNKEDTALCIKVTKNYSYSEKNESKSEKNYTKEIKGKESNNICAPEPHDEQSNKEEKLLKDFEIIYSLYPKKRGRTVAFAEYKQWVSEKGKDVGCKRYHLTNRQIYLAVKKYIRQQEESGQDDYQYWKNFDTLMGRQLLDYVDLEDGKK